ncbi:MAG: hypothetical protein OXQ92_15180 [Boseongicola sp.]|nr:hypothetical protein [Boseongicola sp.]
MSLNFSLEQFPDADFPVLVEDPSHAHAFGLGQNHLHPNRQLNTAWLLSEALYRHRSAIAARTSIRGADLVDSEGKPVIPVVLCASVSGLSSGFSEGDTVAFDIGLSPSPENGWRSLVNFRNYAGDGVRIELVTEFRHIQMPNTATPPMNAPYVAPLNARALSRSRELLQDGARLMNAARSSSPNPRFEIEIIPNIHLNGAGLIDPNIYSDFIRQCSHARSESQDRTFVELSQRLHVFHHYDVPRRLSLDCDGVGTTIFRNADDNQIVAIAETETASSH